MPPSAPVFSVSSLDPQFKNAFGNRAIIDQKNLPILQGMALYFLTLNPGAFREPHWHPNANELAYCTKGKTLITIFSNGNLHDTFSISKGEMFFVPSGYLHSIENVGSEDVEFVIVFNHECPEDFGISGSAGCMSPSVLGNTWDLPTETVRNIRYSSKNILIGKADGDPEIPHEAAFPNHYKFPLESIFSTINTSDGSIKMAVKQVWPILEGLSMFSLRMSGTGMREPHWHPKTAELGYVLTGQARMTLLRPSDDAVTYKLNAGDLYFIPKAYPHHIENLENNETRFLIFFDHSTPQDIGFTGGFSAFPKRIVAPTLGITAKEFPNLLKYSSDKILVTKRNPVAP